MSREEIQARTTEKLRKVDSLMKELHLRVEGRQRISKEGFIENLVFFIDEEQYPVDAPVETPVETPAVESGPNPEGSAAPAEENV